MSSRAALIDRVRKLQDRAKRDAGAEAQSARNLARTLIREHGITPAELRPPAASDTARKLAQAAATGAPPLRVDFQPGKHIDVEIGDVRVRWSLRK